MQTEHVSVCVTKQKKRIVFSVCSSIGLHAHGHRIPGPDITSPALSIVSRPICSKSSVVRVAQASITSDFMRLLQFAAANKTMAEPALLKYAWDETSGGGAWVVKGKQMDAGE